MTIRSAVSVRLFFIRRSHASSLTHIPWPYINRIGLPRTVISALSPSHHTGHYNWPQIKSYYRNPFPSPNCSDGILLWNHRQVRIPSWKSDYDPSHISALQILPVLQSLVSSFYPTPLPWKFYTKLFTPLLFFKTIAYLLKISYRVAVEWIRE